MIIHGHKIVAEKKASLEALLQCQSCYRSPFSQRRLALSVGLWTPTKMSLHLVCLYLYWQLFPSNFYQLSTIHVFQSQQTRVQLTQTHCGLKYPYLAPKKTIQRCKFHGTCCGSESFRKENLNNYVEFRISQTKSPFNKNKGTACLPSTKMGKHRRIWVPPCLLMIVRHG